MTNDQYDAKQVIEAFGGTTATARLCNITKGAVSQWVRNGIPQPRLMFLKVKRPKVFRGLEPIPQSESQPQ